MKLTTEKVLEYYEAFSRLDGYARDVEVNGRHSVVIESYQLSPKVKWHAALNKIALRPIKEAAEAQRKQEQAALDQLIAGLDPKMEPAEMAKTIKDAETASNARLAAIMKNETDIPGLMKLPGVGVRIRARDPGIINILTSISQDFLDGAPDFGQDRAADPAKAGDAD